MLNIPVILGSVREGRHSEKPARFLVEKIKALGHTSQLVDFTELPLPFIDTPKEPSDYERQYPNENVRKWSKIADAADAFVLVVPEYNHGYSGVLKNALDWLFPEYEHKVVGLAGVSTGILGGARAIENIRPVIEAFKMFAIRETVMFGKIENIFDAEGKLLDESYNKKVDGLLKSLVWSAEALKKARDESTKY